MILYLTLSTSFFKKQLLYWSINVEYWRNDIFKYDITDVIMNFKSVLNVDWDFIFHNQNSSIQPRVTLIIIGLESNALKTN